MATPAPMAHTAQIAINVESSLSPSLRILCTETSQHTVSSSRRRRSGIRCNSTHLTGSPHPSSFFSWSAGTLPGHLVSLSARLACHPLLSRGIPSPPTSFRPWLHWGALRRPSIPGGRFAIFVATHAADETCIYISNRRLKRERLLLGMVALITLN
jgi:hypothetical protein